MSYQLWSDTMITNSLKENFKKDVYFSGWTDTQGLKTECQAKNSHVAVIAEIKSPSSNKKIQLITANGVNLRFLQGNKIELNLYWANAVKDITLESKVTDYLDLPFAQGREVYRSLMAITSGLI
jgi:hypothetical protein